MTLIDELEEAARKIDCDLCPAAIKCWRRELAARLRQRIAWINEVRPMRDLGDFDTKAEAMFDAITGDYHPRAAITHQPARP